jgi:hypothetical protein
LAPGFDVDVYLVLDELGQFGRVYCETDEAQADRATIIRRLMTGQYNSPVRIVCFNTAEGWSRDATEDIAREIKAHAERTGEDYRRACVTSSNTIRALAQRRGPPDRHVGRLPAAFPGGLGSFEVGSVSLVGISATRALVMLDGPNPWRLSRHTGTGMEYPTDLKAAPTVGNVGDRVVRLGELVWPDGQFAHRVRFSERESSVHTQSLAGFITNTCEFRFSVHTTACATRPRRWG